MPYATIVTWTNLAFGDHDHVGLRVRQHGHVTGGVREAKVPPDPVDPHGREEAIPGNLHAVVPRLVVLVPSQAVHGDAVVERLRRVLGSAEHEGIDVDYDRVRENNLDGIIVAVEIIAVVVKVELVRLRKAGLERVSPLPSNILTMCTVFSRVTSRFLREEVWCSPDMPAPMPTSPVAITYLADVSSAAGFVGSNENTPAKAWPSYAEDPPGDRRHHRLTSCRG